MASIYLSYFQVVHRSLTNCQEEKHTRGFRLKKICGFLYTFLRERWMKLGINWNFSRQIHLFTCLHIFFFRLYHLITTCRAFHTSNNFLSSLLLRSSEIIAFFRLLFYVLKYFFSGKIHNKKFRIIFFQFLLSEIKHNQYLHNELK